MNDNLDTDSLALGGSDWPSDGSFNPLIPGFGQTGDEDSWDDGTSDGEFGDDSSPAERDHADNIVGHGRFDTEGYRIHEPDDGGPLPWQRAGDIGILGEAERRAREGADTGNRNVRRTAEERTGGNPTGGSGTGVRTDQPRVADSISAAAERIRADIRVPLDARERSAAVIKWETSRVAPGGGKIRRQYVRDDPDAPMQFMSADFECMMTGLKANASGNWILTLQIRSEDGQAIFPLHQAFGLALDVHVQRRRYAPDSEV